MKTDMQNFSNVFNKINSFTKFWFDLTCLSHTSSGHNFNNITKIT